MGCAKAKAPSNQPVATCYDLLTLVKASTI